MKLLAICQDAVKDTGHQDIPGSIANNADPATELFLFLVNRLGRHLALHHDF